MTREAWTKFRVPLLWAGPILGDGHRLTCTATKSLTWVRDPDLCIHQIWWNSEIWSSKPSPSSGGWWCLCGHYHACIPLGLPCSLLEHVMCMFEHVMYMLEHVMYMFEHVMCMFEHVVRTGPICTRHGAVGRPVRLQKFTTTLIIGHLSPDFEGWKISVCYVQGNQNNDFDVATLNEVFYP